MKQIPRILIIAFLSLANFTNGFTQPNCSEIPPLPRMFVYSKDGAERTKAFLDLKYQSLKKINGRQDLTLRYPVEAMKNLIKEINKEEGIRIYLAKYSWYRNSPLPENIESGQLILLFATEHSDESKPKDYYFINPVADDNLPYKVNATDAQDWINDYNSNVQKELRRGLLDNDSNNVDRYDPKGTFSDTKSIFYQKQNIDEAFTTEIQYQKEKHNFEVKTFLVSYSAYTRRGNEKGKFVNRLLLQFDYLNANNDTLNHQNQLDFLCREAKWLERRNTEEAESNKKAKDIKRAGAADRNKKLERIKKIDNGQLCPTNCPPRP